jgi:2,4-dienoyl-CoA reductase-like NADH-dependent reductase (Old Yellow Enzyme family)/thioredoxin reductase
MRLKNRIVHASMSTRYVKQREVTDKLITYHRTRAVGGAAMIVTEPLGMLPHQVMSFRPALFDQENLDGFKRWAEAVESEDCRLVGQMQDSGRGHRQPGRNSTAIGPSPLPDDLSWTVPHQLEGDDIRRLVDAFALSTKKLKASGWSGVEMSAGHGHLFHQFLSPWSNHRDDEYGNDSLENRARFVQQIIEAIRAECGSDFAIGLKLPGDDGVPGGIGPDEAEELVRLFTARNEIDYLCFCNGSHARSLEAHIPDMHYERGTFLPLIKRLNEAAGDIPVVAVGRILEPVQGETLIAEGVAELVGLARTLVADPAWGLKAAQNRDNDIRKCVSCNNCWGQINLEKPLGCDNNPRVGEIDEADWWPAPAEVKKRVIVVGGGPAGLEAAWVAAARGHDVTLYTASNELGGKLRLFSELPGCEAVSSVYDYQKVAAAQAGVKIELGWRISAEEIIAMSPDVVVTATGARLSWPTFLPKSLEGEGFIPDLRDVATAILEHPAHQGGTAVIYDADHMDGTYSTAELLRQKFDRVVLITPREMIARDEPLVRQQAIYNRMYNNDIEIVLLSEPLGESPFIDGIVQYKNVISGRVNEIEEVALFTYSTPRVPDNTLAAELKKADVNVILAGDSYAPRSLMMATQEGHRIGNSI